ncbi:MAG: glycosyltransferase, partial [Candidatus Methanoperedens sp.]|nr:glycosyltransferase [Candidatus Methanoperedens sp.]
TRDRIDVVAHHADFSARTDISREEARASLGIPTDRFVFLSIGFIQPHKGFDRAIRAFAHVPGGCELYIVGSVRTEDDDCSTHLADLEIAARSTEGVHLRVGYVSDEEFDRWIVAADVLVLPYRTIWTSGVLARSALYGRPVIATRVGSLEGQGEMLDDVVFVDDDEGLAEAMMEAAGQASGRDREVVEEPWGAVAGGERSEVLAEIRRRAALERGSTEPFMWDAARVNGAARTPGSGDVALAPLEALPKLGIPEPKASGMLRRLAQVAVRRVTAWEIDPLVNHINRLHAADMLTSERLSFGLADRQDGPGTDAAEPPRYGARKAGEH